MQTNGTKSKNDSKNINSNNSNSSNKIQIKKILFNTKEENKKYSNLDLEVINSWNLPKGLKLHIKKDKLENSLRNGNDGKIRLRITLHSYKILTADSDGRQDLFPDVCSQRWSSQECLRCANSRVVQPTCGPSKAVRTELPSRNSKSKSKTSFWEETKFDVPADVN